MASEHILVDVKGPVAVVTLNRPEQLNAMTQAMSFDMGDAFAELEANDDVRVIMVTGAGRAFCAGADISKGWGGTNTPQTRPRTSAIDMQPWTMTKPIIAAINGPAVGMGMTYSVQWDIRVAAENARMGFVFVRRGIVPDPYVPWILTRMVGLSRAKHLMLTGEIISARQALEWGIVTKIWPDAEFKERALEFAEEIATNTAPAAIAATKRLISRGLAETDIEMAVAVERQALDWTFAHPDSKEGVAAFLQKRKPQWHKPMSPMPDFLPRGVK